MDLSSVQPQIAQQTLVDVPFFGQVDPVVLTAWATVALAIFTILLVIATAFFMWHQERRASQLHGFDMLMRLRDEFFGPRYLASRDKSAQLLLSNNLQSDAVGYSNDLNRLANFFERVEYFISQGALDEEMVWFSFENYVIHYYPCLEAYIASRRRHNPLAVANVGKLHERMLKVGRKKAAALGQLAHTAPSDDDVRTFLENEVGPHLEQNS